MTATRVYLDHNATTPVRPEAVRAMAEALARVGNPSSVHAEGRAARALMEQSREAVAALVGADPRCVTFTSGATEALGLALSPLLELRADRRGFDLLLIAAVEHAAVLRGHRFPHDRVERIAATSDGALDLEALRERLGRLDGRRPMLALQAANNETGVVQPVRAAADLVHAAGGVLVCDAVQAAGRLPITLPALGADLLAVTAHKLGGPAGVGALVRASEAIHVPDPVLRGGGQERGLRAGTENLAGIVGFGVAARLALAERASEAERLRALRDRLEAGLRAVDRDALVFGAAAERLPNTTAFASPGVSAETALIALDLEGVAASSGSACSSGKVKASHVLDAMGVAPDLREGMLRISLGWTTREADIERFLNVWSRIRRFAAAPAAA